MVKERHTVRPSSFMDSRSIGMEMILNFYSLEIIENLYARIASILS
jgi:hypothetical protein